jgi:[acyl-carrier-protein] S-malonyltransferase
LGFVFPGQGSQAVGMLAQLRDEAPVGSTFEEADDVLGFDLGQIVAQGPEERLNQTEVTQPALLTASVALWRLWRHRGGPEPTLLSGHSLGEYSALVCGEGLTFGDAVALVHQRGKLMQAAVPAGEGAMAAILGLDDDQVRSCCESVDDVVAAANFNAPGQVVIAGASAAVDAAIANCQDAGARRAMKLAVSVPSHCQLMEQAATEFADKLKAVNLEKPRIPVIHNVDANVADSADGVKSALIAQLSNPVLWSTSVTEMAAHGVTNAVECGPGKVLAGLIKRIDRSLTVAAMAQ